MLQLVVPAGSLSKVQMFTDWMDEEGIVYTKSGNTMNLFTVPEGCEGVLDFYVTGLLKTSITEVQVEAPRPAPEDRAEELTWYKFRAIVQGRTRYLPPVPDVMDEVYSWSITGEGDATVFSWVVRKVVYVETKARYKAKSAVIQMHRIIRDKESSRGWDWQCIECPDEEGPTELVKFGGVTSPEEYWDRRVAEAMQIDWTEQRMKTFHNAMRFKALHERVAAREHRGRK